MTEWQEVQLQDVVTVLGDGLHGTPKYDTNGEYYFINGNNLNNGKIIIKDNTQRCSSVEYEKYKKNLNDKTILVSINGTIGNVALYNNEKCILGKSACYFNVIPDVSKHFVKYIVTNKTFQTYIDEFANGTTIKNVSLKTIREFNFLLPPLPEQEAIAEVLSSLDDKIDLLHRNNKTLEQLAETLFRQWFVEQADDSWEEKSLDEIAVYLNGLALQKYPAVSGEETLPVIKIREMNQGITEATDTCSAKIPEQYIVRNGDILFSWSGSLDVVLWSGCDGALNQHLFKVSSTDFPKWLIYFGTKLFLPEFRSIAHDKATTMGHIQRKHLTQSVLKLPDAQKIKEYDIRMSGMVDKIISNNSQIKQLEQLRDTLLPKLMSGEVRVQDIKTTIPA